jgi:hypothetical protein
MNGRSACHALLRIPAYLAGVAGLLGFSFSASGSQAEFQIPECFAHAVPLELSERAERTAEAHAHYMQAIFEEETEGPDKALETKKRVLALDPGFCDLALDVAQRAYVIEGGRIVTTGNPKELMTQPHIRQAYLGEAA